ncbi:MAG: FG-GAP-like repeat-containing protein, partial [Candidatus Paceibacterota bacterium]
SYNRVSTLNVSDLDNDGYKDIISGDREHGVLRWYRNTGSGSFESARKISVLLKGIQSIYTVDLDNDGDDDIVTNSDHSGKIIIFENVGGNESIRRKDEFSLKQNYPNPFNPSTIIEYGIQEKTFVNISIFNLLGEKVRTLVNESKNKGYYSIQFNASELASGVYFYRLKTVNFVETKKLTIIK